MLDPSPSLPFSVADALTSGRDAQCPLDVSELRRDAWTRLVRARHGDRHDTALVLVADPHAPDFVRQRLRRAATLSPMLSGDFAVQAQRLLETDAGMCLVLDDPGGQLLEHPTLRERSVGDALRLVRGIAEAVASSHARGCVHNDLRPANVLTRDDGRAWLLGYGRASCADEPSAPLVLTDAADSLPYMSPELTGRMNRPVDERSDLYSLGVMLYELLAGDLPFTAHSPMEWVHCHVAREPLKLSQKVPDCPLMVLGIVDRLLAKAAEDRYQTAGALIDDLDRAISDWHAHDGAAVVSAAEHLQRLAAPQRLRDRTSQLDVLKAAYERVGKSGAVELVLVSGASGIGKSALVHELRRHVAQQGGLFASGKFEQSQNDAPYATLAQGFGALLADVLLLDEAQRAHWRSKLGAALGVNAVSLQGTLPELAALLGPINAAPDLSPTDAATRFRMAMANLVTALVDAGQPLVLFIDDLQWLDESTLDVLQHLMSSGEPCRWLFVGAYRTNEVGAEHGLHRLIGTAQAQGVRTTELPLSALPVSELRNLLAETLDMAPERVTSLASYLAECTGGNPFFSLQLIRALADDGLLHFDAASQGWNWDLGAIKAHEQKNDVREFLIAKLARLPDDLRYRIETLSCFGSSANTRCMAVACDVEMDQCGAYADAAEQGGFITKTEGGYRFAHDRIQEAAYALIPEADRPRRHLEIARRLCANLTDDEVKTHIFDIANQLAPGITLIEEHERLRAAAHFKAAGERARAETAYAAALRHFEHADALLGSDRWTSSYALALAVAIGMAECRFLLGEMHAAEVLLLDVQDHARNTVDRADVTWRQVTLYTALDRSDEAIRTCLRFLETAGVEIPPHPDDAEVEREYQAMVEQLDALGGARALLTLPAASDPAQRAVLDALAAMLPPAFFSDANLVCYALCRMARLSLAHGNGDASALAYAYLGMVISHRFDAYALAFELGRVGYELVERNEGNRYRGRVYMTFAYHVSAWAKPLGNSLDLLRQAYRIARDGGDVTYAGFSSCTLVTSLLSHSTHLADVQAEARERLRYVSHAKFGLVSDIMTAQLQLIATLRGQTRDIGSFDDEHFSEAEHEARLVADRNLDIARCWYWIRKAHARFMTNRFEEAEEALQQAEPLLWTSTGHFEMAQYQFGAALTRTACCHGMPQAHQDALVSKVQTHLNQLRTWAVHCPDTFGFRVSLVEAEMAGVQGRMMEAMQGYERALAQVHQKAPQHIALTLETAARFYRRNGLGRTAQSLLAQARDLYQRWGADGKVAQLERDFPDIRPTGLPRQVSEVAPNPFQDADAASMLKTSQAVSHDAGLDELMRALMEIALEHAGANRGVLILPKGDQLRIEALARFGADGAEVGLQSVAVAPTDLPLAVLHHVIRTAGAVLLDDARESEEFSKDPYIAEGRCRSVLCLPLIRKNELIAVLYLENSLVSHVFTQSRVALLNLLVVTAALYIENASLEEKESLLKEVHHRVKNNLQLISSLLSLQASRIPDKDVAELFAESRHRVRSMAMVHENLYRAGNFARVPMPAHIGKLCAELSHAYGMAAQCVEVQVEVDDIQLDLDRAVSCGLIINELLSNALKHAFRQRDHGRVQVSLHLVGDGQCELSVADDGKGLPADLDISRAATLGLQLVDDLAAQLRGELTLERDGGARFRIRFPVNDAGGR